MSANGPDHTSIARHLPAAFGPGVAALLGGHDHPSAIFRGLLLEKLWTVTTESTVLEKGRFALVVDLVPVATEDLDARLHRTEILLEDDAVAFLYLRNTAEPTTSWSQTQAWLRPHFSRWTFRVYHLEAVTSDGAWMRATRRRPLAMLLLGDSMSGKTSTARALSGHGLVCHNGDAILRDIAEGVLPTSAALREAASLGHAAANWAHTIGLMCHEGMLEEFLSLILSRSAPGEDLVFEMVVPAAHQEIVVDRFTEAGYWPVLMTSGQAASVQSVRAHLREAERPPPTPDLMDTPCPPVPADPAGRGRLARAARAMAIWVTSRKRTDPAR